jgi:hypothetical protein
MHQRRASPMTAFGGLATAALILLPLGASAADVCFFEHYNYQGASHCTSATSGEVGAAVADRISSVKVPAGVKLSLYENGGASGRMLVLSGDAPNLAMAGFNNLTSSFRRESTDTGALQVVFIGNSFTHGNANPVLHYNSVNVTDLNGSGYGGMPGIFKQLTVEAGLNYQVAIEAVSSQTLKFHYTSKREVLDNQRWDAVVMQDQSNLDPAAPGNPTNLITYSGLLEKFIHGVDVNANANANPKANVWLLATWPRPDEVYQPGGHWYGQTLEQAAAVLSNGYLAAATQNRGTAGMIPVGDAFVRAIGQGVADRNPYDGIDGDKFNLWSGDNHHASAAGSYLEALMAFARLTGRDPRALGANSVAARAMNLTAAQTTALQEIAYRQLLASQAP